MYFFIFFLPLVYAKASEKMNLKQILVGLSLLLTTFSYAQNKLIAYDAELTQAKYPFPVHFKTLNAQEQQLKMAYMDVQPQKPNGKTIVLLHGKYFNGSYWEKTAKALSENGFRVIIADQVGFGKSSKPKQYQFSFHQLAENTKSILDSLKIEKFQILGHSMGGMLATRMALMYPENVEKLILENPIGLEDYKLIGTYQDIDKQYKSELKKNFDAYKKYMDEFYFDHKWKPEYDELLNYVAGWTISKDFPITAWNAALTSDMVYTQPVVYEFEKLNVPTLLIIGTRDRTAIGKAFAPKELQPLMGQYQLLGKETQKKIKGSQLVELDGVGHLPHVEVFDRFIQPLLQFVKN